MADIEWMKSKFLECINETIGSANFQSLKILELIVVEVILKIALDKIQSKINKIDELTDHQYHWVVKANNVFIPSAKEKNMVIEALKIHKETIVVLAKKN